MQTIQANNVTTSGLQFLEALGQIGDKFSEDCLTVNVWTKPQVGEAQKAVLVWIYGGAFTTGNSDNPGYNGQYIADQEDVVLVSFNYRLNIFGFPGNPNGTQNLGLLDQRLAVQWIKNNIASFGGDPARITLFGQSAGSASVDYYSYAWVDDPIAHSFIQESGSVFGPPEGLGAISATTASGYWFNTSSILNCGNATSDQASTLACMKSKSFEDILKAMAVTSAEGSSAISSSFSPTVDDKVVFSNYTSRSIAGNFAKLPLLLGNADYEAGLFKLLDGFSNITLSDGTWDAFNDVGFTCPCAERANVSVSNKVPTWRYRWFGAFPNTELTTVPFSGAYHASELPILFNVTPSGSGIPNNTAAETAIGSYMRGAWATFAKDPVNGLLKYEDGWPMYSPGEETLIRLAYQNMTGTNLAIGTTYDLTCGTTFSAGNSSSNETGSSSSSSTSAAPSQATGTSGVGSSAVVPFTCLVLATVFCMSLVVL